MPKTIRETYRGHEIVAVLNDDNTYTVSVGTREYGRVIWYLVDNTYTDIMDDIDVGLY